ncbi:unnamed protein product [Parnassius apollo]|uniref:(apollo) hypothetical protein n=1 Tax=Parnassius apollo TaxID=110799 RepID=A0A8S3W220_PARAO|nr:unnamed protein product [Parnassius apollo]
MKRPRPTPSNEDNRLVQKKERIKKTHTPVITIRDEDLCANTQALTAVRQVTSATNSKITLAAKQIFIAPSSIEARRDILKKIEELNPARVIAPKPMGERNMMTKIVIKNETFGETVEAIAEEINRCIGITPLRVKPIGKSGRLHLLLFENKYTVRHILHAFDTSQRTIFCAKKNKAQPYMENLAHINQCKNCYAFDHTKHSCYGTKKDPTMITVTATGATITVCSNCKHEGHGANQVNCPAFQKQLAIRERVLLDRQAKSKERSEAARVRKETTFAQALRSNKEFPQLGASSTSITTDEELGPTPPLPPRQTALTASTDQPNMDILLAILQRMDSVVAEVNNMRTEMNSLKTELLIIKRAKTATTVNG